jgi:cell wall assembly regulator SMI1
MREELKIEVERLEKFLNELGQPFETCSGTTLEEIQQIENETQIKFSQDLKDLWQFSNGSHYQNWFAVFSDELTFCDFPSIEYAKEAWSWHLPYDETIYKEWCDPKAVRDSRILPSVLVNRSWFPVAEFNGYSTKVIFDGIPTETGCYGQIIVYQHDPDAIYYVAESFLDFFKQSNDLFEANREIFKELISI